MAKKVWKKPGIKELELAQTEKSKPGHSNNDNSHVISFPHGNAYGWVGHHS
jgi:hypothetical protein